MKIGAAGSWFPPPYPSPLEPYFGMSETDIDDTRIREFPRTSSPPGIFTRSRDRKMREEIANALYPYVEGDLKKLTAATSDGDSYWRSSYSDGEEIDAARNYILNQHELNGNNPTVDPETYKAGKRITSYLLATA